MKCIDTEDLSLYLENEVSEIQYLLITSHIEECTTCRRILNQLKIVDWELEHDKVFIPSEELENVRLYSINSAFDQQYNNDFTFSNLYNLQVNTFKNSVNFIKYLPGANKLDNQVNIKKSLESSMNKLLNKMLENVGIIK